MTNVEINNPSAFHALRIFQQARVRNVIENTPAATPIPTRETRAELEKRGATITMKPCRGTVQEGGVLRSVVRDVPTPLWQAEGADSLAHWVTDIMEQGVRDSQKAVPAAPRGERVVDSWGAAKGHSSIAPRAKVNLDPPLEENKRYVIESDDADGVTLQIQNQSAIRTLRLRNRTESGDIHVAFVAPLQVAIVTARKSVGAIVELTPQ